MKKFLLTITCSFIILLSASAISPAKAEASSHIEKTQIVSEYFNTLNDGSYFHITITETLPKGASLFSRTTRSVDSIQTTSGSKNISYYSSDNEIMWEFTLYGSFQYSPGAIASCTSVSYSINICDSSWETLSASSSKSGNQASGNASFKKKLLFFTTNVENVHISLSCDSYGNLY